MIGVQRSIATPSLGKKRCFLAAKVPTYEVDRSEDAGHALATEVFGRSVKCGFALTVQAFAELTAETTMGQAVPGSEAAAQPGDGPRRVPAAAGAGCSALPSEDLSGGAVFDGPRVRDLRGAAVPTAGL